MLWDFTGIGKEEISLEAESCVKVVGVCEKGFYEVEFGEKKGVIQSDYCSDVEWRRKI